MKKTVLATIALAITLTSFNVYSDEWSKARSTIWGGTIDELQELLETGIDLNHINKSDDIIYGESLMHMVSSNCGDLVAERLKLLMAYGGDPDIPILRYDGGSGFSVRSKTERDINHHKNTPGGAYSLDCYNNLLEKWAVLESSEKYMNTALKDDSVAKSDSGSKSDVGSLELSISDACRDGRDIKYRIFGYSTSSPRSSTRIGVAPKTGRVYIAKDSGEKVTSKHSCRTTSGHTVRSWCYGAKRPSGHYWGVGIDGEKGCSDCCTSCPVEGTSSRSMRLICN